MSDERHDDERAREILGRPLSVTVPPFDALRQAPPRSVRTSIAVTLATIIVAVAAIYAGREVSTFRQQASPIPGVAAPSARATQKVTLPEPIPQPITRTSPAAQVAWIATSTLDPSQTSRTAVLVGVDPSGKLVGRIDGATDPWVTRRYRSADGALILTVGDKVITAYSALDGTVERTYPREPADGVVDAAFSPDGRWFALIGSSAYVQVIELRTGLTQTTPLAHDPKPQTPGLTVAPGVTLGLIWSTLVFAPDSKRLYTIVDWAGPLRVTAFDVTSTGLVQTASAVDGQGGKTLPGCGGPGLAARVVGGGQTLVFFCHVDGSVEFIDLATMTASTVRAEMKNPFWLAPIFTPDGQLLYLHQYPAFGDFMQVVDLRSHALLGPVPTPTKTEEPGPFSWLFTVAYAGGTPSTVPVSPDGRKVYAAATGAIVVLRVPDLKPVARLAESYSPNEVWISGDGKTVYATDGGKGLLVIREDGSAPPIVVTLPNEVGGFVASEHG